MSVVTGFLVIEVSSKVVLNKEIGVSRILVTGDVLVRTGLDGHLGLIMQG